MIYKHPNNKSAWTFFFIIFVWTPHANRWHRRPETATHMYVLLQARPFTSRDPAWTKEGVNTPSPSTQLTCKWVHPLMATAERFLWWKYAFCFWQYGLNISRWNQLRTGGRTPRTHPTPEGRVWGGGGHTGVESWREWPLHLLHFNTHTHRERERAGPGGYNQPRSACQPLQ